MKPMLLSLISLILIHSTVFSQPYTSEQLKADYLMACELIATKYIYFERKSPHSRAEFIQRISHYADSIVWAKDTFVKEIRTLRSLFPDGHFDWELPAELSPIDGFYTLGFTPTFTVDSALVVKNVFPYFNSQIKTGDTIVAINGQPAKEFIKEFGARAPQSTPAATYEVAARNIALLNGTAPIADNLKDIELKITKNQKQLRFLLPYKKCGITTDIAKSRENEDIVLLQRNGYLSLEEIPEEFISPHPSLLLYELKINEVQYCILHPRDFIAWKAADIDSVMGIINSLQPDVLVIDLKDCSGGGFNAMLYMSYAVNVKKEFYFFYDIMSDDNKRFSGVSNFNFITDTISLQNTWRGPLIVRSNEICGSACDFFIRWMKINNRARIIGMPPAGRGGGTDGFALKNTKTRISFPLRERIPLSYPSSVEGETMQIDFYSEFSIRTMLEELTEKLF